MKNKLIKTLVVLAIVFLTGRTLSSQYTIINYPPPISFTHLDLWHFTITGTLDTTMVDYYVTVRVFNDQNSLLVKSQSSDFSLSSPTLYVAPTDLGPLQPLIISYTIDAFYANIVNNGGLFPAGNYQIEYALYGRPTDGEFSELTNSSFNASVESLFPPMLISVENGDTICEVNPVFTWTPAYQTTGTTNLTYTFNMVEISLSQSPYQAITSNPSFYTQSDIPITMMYYPPYASPLVYNQAYAWQVDAIIDNQVAASSEIWSFVYGCPTDTIIDSIPSLPYVKLRLERDGGEAILINKFIYINYNERYTPKDESHLNYQIYNMTTNEIMSTNNTVLDVIEGENYYIISTCPDGLNLPDGTYQFIVTDDKGSKWYMDFVKENIECN